MCCEADWKREAVPDHKFDFINIREFHRSDLWTRIKYILRYIFLLKSIAVYGLDVFTAVTLITTDHWTNSIQGSCGDDCAVPVKFQIAKWVFVGCIIFSFVLLAYETWKAKKVIESRDISYAFTNLLANDYYSFKSYDNFCLFCYIDASAKRKDDFAFFIFFTFKGWKRLLLADGPRQSINALLLYSFGANHGWTTDIPSYWDGSAVTAMLLFAMIATVLIFAGSLIMLIAAAVLYIPLLCYIQGNLKEYVCHKVDKRISELIKKKQRQRIARNAALEKKMAAGGLKNSKGEVVSAAVPQPTLPNVSLDDDDDDLLRAKRKADKAGLVLPQENEYDSGLYPGAPPINYDYDQTYGYPPALDYNAPPNVGNGFYQNSEGYESTTRLTAAAAPLGISYPPAAATPPNNGPPQRLSPEMGQMPSSYASSQLPNPYARPISPYRPQAPPTSQSYGQAPNDYRSPPYQYARRQSANSGHSGYSGRSGGLAYDDEYSQAGYYPSQSAQGYGGYTANNNAGAGAGAGRW